MSALVLFIVLALAAAGLFVAGAYLVAGLGVALLTGGLCSAAAAAILQRGLSRG